jgi:large subunit ribosomal protein L25
LSHNQIWHAAQKEAFYSHILDLSVDGKIEKVVVKDMQRHPFKPLITHVDFLRVSADQKLKTHIPLHCVNEEICVGAKAGGLIMHDMIEVEISCLPKDLPEFIQVDVAALNIGDSLHLSQLPIPAGVELTELVRGHDQAVVSVVKVRGADKEEGEETEESAE